MGLHGNSGLWLPQDDSHRIALVFYQTQLKIIPAASKGVGTYGEGAETIAQEVKSEAAESLLEVPAAFEVAMPRLPVPER